MSAPTVLVTGAAGLVGTEVVARLTDRGYAVTALTHRRADGSPGPDTSVRNDGSPCRADRTVPGDVCVPGLGLGPGDVDELAAHGVAIVHCAATTAFDASEDTYDRLNVAGTAHVVDLALATGLPLVHVSTAYVCGMREGTVLARDTGSAPGAPEDAQRFGNGYERSKFRAELAVGAAAERGLRRVIVRPGIVSGASDTGVIRDHKNLYTVLRLMVEAKLRTLPGRYDATLALAPIDHVADVVTAATIALADGAPGIDGTTVHAVGRDRLSLRELSDVLAEYPSFAVARFVPASTFSADDLDPIEREYFRRIGSLYTSYFERRLGFDTTEADALLGRPAPDSGPEYLRLLLDAALDCGFLGAALPSVQDVLARFGPIGTAERSAR